MHGYFGTLIPCRPQVLARTLQADGIETGVRMESYQRPGHSRSRASWALRLFVICTVHSDFHQYEPHIAVPRVLSHARGRTVPSHPIIISSSIKRAPYCFPVWVCARGGRPAAYPIERCAAFVAMMALGDGRMGPGFLQVVFLKELSRSLQRGGASTSVWTVLLALWTTNCKCLAALLRSRSLSPRPGLAAGLI